MSITWPEVFSPGEAPAHVTNEIDIKAPPERVFAWLRRAPLWPDWRPNSQDVRLEGGGEGLELGAKFVWRTFGVEVRSEVKDYAEGARIAWNASALFLKAWHAWLIEPRPFGCHVLTEETQRGLAARAQAALAPNRMHAGHALWLSRLKSVAEAGPPH
jgi:uncharacterized protein YndB with AHSA1/START domain